MDLSKIHPLTIKYGHITNAIACSVNVSFPKSLLLANETAISDTCVAIWDTGATASAITEIQAKKLQLRPTGLKRVSGLGGTIDKKTYLIDIHLPNNIAMPNLSVTEIDNPKDENGRSIETFGMLIGMDIIATGDFTITNFEGKTIMSFRIPSITKIDFVEEWNRRKAVEDKHKGFRR